MKTRECLSTKIFLNVTIQKPASDRVGFFFCLMIQCILVILKFIKESSAHVCLKMDECPMWEEIPQVIKWRSSQVPTTVDPAMKSSCFQSKFSIPENHLCCCHHCQKVEFCCFIKKKSCKNFSLIASSCTEQAKAKGKRAADLVERCLQLYLTAKQRRMAKLPIS